MCAGGGPELAHPQGSSTSRRVWVGHSLTIRLIEWVQRCAWDEAVGKRGCRVPRETPATPTPKPGQGGDGECGVGPGMGPAGSPGAGGHAGWVLEDHPGWDLEHSWDKTCGSI